MNFDEFENQFVRKVGRRKSLIEFPNGDCVFFDRIHLDCRIYDVRPIQCRTWPFWASNLESCEDWEKISRTCKGCNRGTLHSLDEIEEQKVLRDM